MTNVNVIYGYFTDGDCTERRTTTSRNSLPKTAKMLLDALLPLTLTKEDIRGVAELYIRLCFCDKSVVDRIAVVDPLNSYTLHSIYGTISHNVDTHALATAGRNTGIIDVENSATDIDVLMQALSYFLTLV